MFVFVDESGSTNINARQKYLVLSFCVCNNKQFAEDLIRRIRKNCEAQGKQIRDPKEIKYHDISRFQQEIAIKLINKEYHKFYLAYVDVEKADASLTTGKNEERIQTQMLLSIAGNFADKIEKKEEVIVIIDEKLSKESLDSVRRFVQVLRKSKKNLRVEERKSQTISGLQLADLIAGAFRAKLMKTSGLLDVVDDHIFECEPKPNGLLTKPNNKNTR
ncbi:MAG: DUF3800 domain-containing protein [Candidatus Micrarchaeota archaeon]